MRHTLLALALLAPATLAAQAPRHAVAVVGGISGYDLSGTGVAGLAALRVDRLLAGRWLLAEGSLGVFRPEEQAYPQQFPAPGGASTVRGTYLIPEAQLQLQAPLGPIAPYLGGGVGLFYATRGDFRIQHDFTLSTSVGVRVQPASSPLGFRTELRVRTIGEHFSGSTAEGTAGFSWRF